MHLLAHARNALAATALTAMSLSPVWADSWVSARSATVNLRAQPSTRAEVLWQLSQGYPLQVVKRQGQWLQVQDFEGDQGWVAKHVTSQTPHHIVKTRTANLRSGPGTQYRLVGKASYGDILQPQGRQGEWVKVKHPEQKGSAWVAKSLLWGW